MSGFICGINFKLTTMKKVLPQIILLLLIYLGIFYTVGDWDPNMLKVQLIMGRSSPDQIPKNSEAAKIINDIKSDSTKMNWEYTKNLLFDEEYTQVYKLKDSIILHTINASEADSIAILNVLGKAQNIIPELNIIYKNDFNDEGTYHAYTNNTQSLNSESLFYIHFEKVNQDNAMWSLFEDDKISGFFTGFNEFYFDNLDNEGFTEPDFPDTKGNYKYLRAGLTYNLSNKSTPAQNLHHIEYGIFRLLGNILSKYNAKLKSKYTMNRFRYPLNDMNNFSGILNGNSTDPDIFFLQKLYITDFKDQFQEYMYDTYPWPYALNFLNKNKAKNIALSLVSIIGMIVIFLALSIFKRINCIHPILSYIIPIFTFWTFYLALDWLYKYLTDMNFSNTYETNFIFVLFGIGVSLISGTVLYFFEKASYLRNNFTIGLLLKVFLTCFILSAPLILSVQLTSENLDELLYSEFFISFIIPVLFLSLGRGIIIYLDHYSENLIREKDLELSVLKEKNTFSQLRLLQAQINPHFLYNSLNSIAGLAHKDADKTEQMALSLSDLFRYTIGQKKSNTASIVEEVDMVERYLEIEKIRFGDRLDFIIEVDPDLKNLEIPRFILQPLVENAIKHGTSKLKEKGIIRLNISSIDNKIILSVYDNGPDFPDGLLSGHGLQSVSDLLDLNYGEEASLNWENLPHKKIEIRLPKTLKNE